jgi:hypothetical protein
MSAFTAKLGEWFGKYVIQYVVRYLWDHVTAWLERQRLSKDQIKRDNESKEAYQKAIESGTNEEIIRQTEDRFNS